MCASFAARTGRSATIRTCGYLTLDMRCVNESGALRNVAVCSVWSPELDFLPLLPLYEVRFAMFTLIGCLQQRGGNSDSSVIEALKRSFKQERQYS